MRLSSVAESVGLPIPEAVDFDGATTFLKHSGDLSGNADGKTLTCSLWFYIISYPTVATLYHADGGFFVIEATSGKDINVVGFTSAAGAVLNFLTDNPISFNTWNHLLFSVDMTDTGKRFVYLNDVNITADITWTSYNDLIIDFTRANHAVGATVSGTGQFSGRMSQFFMDYTFRDLTIESNRRLFITDDLKPALGQATLNPILYLEMKNKETAGDNTGTGGAFTINGAPLTSDRGPNQDNCVSSVFNGTNDYTQLGSVTADADGKVATFCAVFKSDLEATNTIFNVGTNRFVIQHRSNGNMRILCINLGTGNTILDWDTQSQKNEADRSIQVAVSVDMNDINKSQCLINNVPNIGLPATFLNQTITMNSQFCRIGRDQGTGEFEGDIGEVYFDNVYTDLEADNPFWDVDANIPKSLRLVLDETGANPLVACPVRGSDPEINLGSEPDFTVFSGPFDGARGGSEYWQRTFWNDLTASGTVFTNYLKSDSGIGGSATATTFTLVLAVRTRTNSLGANFMFGLDNEFQLESTSTQRFVIYLNGANQLSSVSPEFNLGNFFLAAVTYDGAQLRLIVKKRNGTKNIATSAPSETMDLSGVAFVGSITGQLDWPGDIGFVYFSDQFIDINDEDEWDKFFDFFDYPRDLTASIKSGDIPEPLVYMRFGDPDDLGLNGAAGGVQFTPNGSIFNGSDVGDV